MARSSKSGEKWGGGVFSDANHPHTNHFANVSRCLTHRSVDDLWCARHVAYPLPCEVTEAIQDAVVFAAL